MTTTDGDSDERSGPAHRAVDGLDWSQPPARREPGLLTGAATSTPQEGPTPSPVRTRGLLGLVAGVALVAAAVGGIAGGLVVSRLESDDDDGGGAAGAQTAGSLTVQRNDALVQAAEHARPGVIKIQSTRRVAGAVEQDVGSGVVLDAEGHVLTNAHVVLGTETLKAIMPDGSERPAIVLGHDYPFTDIAVLQIGPSNLSPIPVGDSSQLKLGESVLAIGNPLSEFDGSASAGIVSGLNRKRLFDGVMQDDLIQTDAAINNGNSGGALLNLQGELIGMPTAVLRQNRGGASVEGISFALPSNRVMAIARGIITANGNYPRATLGADVQDITPEIAARLPRVTVKAGGLVNAVADGGPAALAGIAAGDVITRVGDQEITADRPFLNSLMPYAPDQAVRVVLNRSGRIIELEVRLGKRN